MEEITSDEVLDLAYDWLCRSRRNAGHNSDVWVVRGRWQDLKPRVQAELRAGTYRLSPTERYVIDGEAIEVWSALDALVLKAIAIVLGRRWNTELSDRCFHVAGRGGAKAAVREVRDAVQENGHVFRTDVRQYYASIDHDILLAQLRVRVADDLVMGILEQYVRRTIYDGGLYTDVECGIPLGCSLSPLMGAVYLDELDRAMEQCGLFYARFMDDWVVMAPGRWKLRKAIRTVNMIMNRLRVEQHPDKTFIGRVSRGFDFLGYHFEPGNLGVAEKTIRKFVSRASRLYERATKKDHSGSSPVVPPVVADYVKRWSVWVKAGLDVVVTFPSAWRLASDGDDAIRYLAMPRALRDLRSLALE